jgi:trans-aconitate methyltransferase
MDPAEFDKVADEYLAIHSRNIRLTGEDPEYFARYKVEEVRRRWTAACRAEPKAILDFGAGVGASLSHLGRVFSNAELTALDVSQKCLAVAESRAGVKANFVCYGGGEIPLPREKFDLIFSACVFHHIDASEHIGLLVRLRALLNSGGWLVIFEHNPINPVTRYIVATSEFDENAVLIPASTLMARETAAGFSKVEVAFTGFFPGALRVMRPLEPYLSALPIGAQYYTLAVR